MKSTELEMLHSQVIMNLYSKRGAFHCAESTHLCFVFLKAAGQDLDACVFTLLGSETVPVTAVLSHTQGSVGQRELTYFSREVDT